MHGSEFARLKVFAAVAERSSFVRAAAVLGLSTSAISQTIRALEDDLGVRLLNRTTRSVGLTEAGERLLERVAPALQELDGAVEAVRTTGGEPAGTLRLSVSSLVMSQVVAPALGAFAKTYPNIRLEVTVDDNVTDLLDGKVDAGIRAALRIPQDMIAVRIGGEGRLVAVASPDYLRAHGRPLHPDDLSRHNCLLFRFADGSVYRWPLEKDAVRFTPSLSGTLVTNNIDLLVQAAADGVGVAFTDESHAADHVAAGRLCLVLEDFSPSFSGWFIYHPSRRQVPMPLQIFIAFMKGQPLLAAAE